MKSYTDIEQSKKLAEILPLESADTIWDLTIPDLPTIRAIPYEDSDYENKYLNIIPAWSLTALLDVLPEINGTPFRIEKIKAEDGYNGYYYHIEYEGIILIPYSKNPIDACYEMIIKLYEQKLL